MKESHKSGLTIVELLFVFAIVLVLSALSVPPLLESKRSASQASCISNLKQHYIAISIYRSDEGRDGVLGGHWEMGLPTLQALNRVAGNLKCREVDPVSCQNPNGYIVAWPALSSSVEEAASWSAYVRKYEDRSILMYDIGHSGNCPVTPLSLNKGLGVTLGGTTIVRIRRFNPDNFESFFDN